MLTETLPIETAEPPAPPSDAAAERVEYAEALRPIVATLLASDASITNLEKALGVGRRRASDVVRVLVLLDRGVAPEAIPSRTELRDAEREGPYYVDLPSARPAGAVADGGLFFTPGGGVLPSRWTGVHSSDVGYAESLPEPSAWAAWAWVVAVASLRDANLGRSRWAYLEDAALDARTALAYSRSPGPGRPDLVFKAPNDGALPRR